MSKKLTREDVERIVKEARDKGERPDLSGADLSGRTFVGIDLSEADLRGTNLNGARLTDANLGEADLSGADLIKAKLIEANLSGADLIKAKLIKADLTAANLSEANLNGANLREADFKWAHMRGAKIDDTTQISVKWRLIWEIINQVEFKGDLSGADLSYAKLAGVDFSGADLSWTRIYETDLSQAYLSRVNLRWGNLSDSDLSEANLSEVFLESTTLANVDLSEVKGLDTVEHLGPSYIDMHTLIKSKGKIPVAFLRGCGLSDLQIEMAKLHNPDLTSQQVTDITYKIHQLHTGGKAFDYHSCFISYSHKDEAFAEKIYTDLQNNGVRCWYAPEDIKGGDKLYPQIDKAIQSHDKLLLVLSARSLQSEWVMTEIRRTRRTEIRDKERKLFPIRLMDMPTLQAWECFDADTGKDLAVEIREYYIPDFSEWEHNEAAYQRAFERLLRDLKAESQNRGLDEIFTTETQRTLRNI